MGKPNRFAQKKRVFNEAWHAAALSHANALQEPLNPEAAAAFIREHYLTVCSPAHRAYLTAPAYGVLFADAHSSVHPDLVGPVVKSRDEAIALHAAVRTERPDVPCVVMAGLSAVRRAALEDQGFRIPEADLMAPGTRIFIDRQGRTPKALLRAYRREGQPLEPALPTPRPGDL